MEWREGGERGLRWVDDHAGADEPEREGREGERDGRGGRGEEGERCESNALLLL